MGFRFDRVGPAWKAPERHRLTVHPGRSVEIGCVCGWASDSTSSRRDQVREWRAHRDAELEAADRERARP